MILLTGGSGFLAEELLTRLDTSKVRILARNEGNLIKVKSRYTKIEIMTGDISDEFVCQKALDGIDKVYHLAAFKHVGLAEDQPYQCTMSNVVGTMHLLKHFRGSLFMAISTDKAAKVAGVYGATKLLMERLVAEYQELFPDIKYRVVRYGNVLYSTGSVLCKWKALMEAGKEVTVTSMEATRFFWTSAQAVDLIFECINNSKDATPHVPKMKAMSIEKLLMAMHKKYGKTDIRVIGLQEGENRHETMDGVTFSDQVEQYSVTEITELI